MIVTIFEECVNGEVRLVNGSSDIQGRVEICLDGVFGTVCNEAWDNADAAVVCRQLGVNSSKFFFYKEGLCSHMCM